MHTEILSDKQQELLPFIEQLAFHKDINYSEEVEYMIPNPPTEKEVKEELISIATDIFGSGNFG